VFRERIEPLDLNVNFAFQQMTQLKSDSKIQKVGNNAARRPEIILQVDFVLAGILVPCDAWNKDAIQNTLCFYHC